jgi:hypothetical protein
VAALADRPADNNEIETIAAKLKYFAVIERFPTRRAATLGYQI